MKVLFATGIYPPDIGGPAHYTELMARAFKENGHSVLILTYGEGGEAADEGIFRVSRKLAAGIRHLFYMFRVLSLGRRTDIIYVQDSFSAGLPAAAANIFLRKPLVLKVVGDYAWEQAQARYGVTDGLNDFQNKRYNARIEIFRILSRFVARRADFVITPSRYLEKIVSGWGVSSLKIKVIYNAVPKLNFQALPLKARPRNILSAGRLVPWKGFEELIFVMREVREEAPGAQLIIVGDGPERAKLENLVLEQGLEAAVHFPGPIPHEQLPELYGTSAAFALNTSYEGFSHQLIEVMAARLPIATTDCGGNAEIFRNGENAVIFPVNDLKAIKSALVKFLTDSDFAEKIAAQAAIDAGQFSQERMVGETIGFFGQLLNGVRVCLVSLDKTILDENSPSFRRMSLYAENVSALAVLILGAGERRKKNHPKLQIISYGGANKILALMRVWIFGRGLMKKLRPQLVVSQDPFFTGLAAMSFAKISKSKLVVEVHGDFWPKDKKLWPSFARNLLARRVLAAADAIRAVSHKAKEGLISFFPAMQTKDLSVFPVISHLPRALNRAEAEAMFPKGAAKVLFVGRLVPEKGLDWFLPIFALASKEAEMSLLVVGDGPLRGKLEDMARELGLKERVKFVGEVSPCELPVYYNTADFLVLPSRQESWGRVVVEAMQCGRPVLLTEEVGVAHDILKDNESALVVPFGNDSKMKESLVRMAKDEQLRKRLGERGSFLAEGLSFKATYDKLGSLWQKVGKK